MRSWPTEVAEGVGRKHFKCPVRKKVNGQCLVVTWIRFVRKEFRGAVVSVVWVIEHVSSWHGEIKESKAGQPVGWAVRSSDRDGMIWGTCALSRNLCSRTSWVYEPKALIRGSRWHHQVTECLGETSVEGVGEKRGSLTHLRNNGQRGRRTRSQVGGVTEGAPE